MKDWREKSEDDNFNFRKVLEEQWKEEKGDKAKEVARVLKQKELMRELAEEKVY